MHAQRFRAFPGKPQRSAALLRTGKPALRVFTQDRVNRVNLPK
jgi:hypothetical protein